MDSGCVVRPNRADCVVTMFRWYFIIYVSHSLCQSSDMRMTYVMLLLLACVFHYTYSWKHTIQLLADLFNQALSVFSLHLKLLFYRWQIIFLFILLICHLFFFSTYLVFLFFHSLYLLLCQFFFIFNKLFWR